MNGCVAEKEKEDLKDKGNKIINIK